MREIKFRAWDNVEDKMYYPGEEEMIHFYFDSYGIVADRFTNIKVQHHDDVYEDVKTEKLEHLIYMQYTGLKDKNGREIYEGDILQTGQYPCSSVDDYVLIVEYDIDRFWGVRTMKANATVRGISNGIADGLYEFLDEEPEVIGNIYENPELIKEVNV